MNPYLENIYYFQFKDLYNIVTIQADDEETYSIHNTPLLNPHMLLEILPESENDSVKYYFCFKGNTLIYSEYLPKYILDKESSSTENKKVRILLTRFILPRMWEKYVVRSKQESTPKRRIIERYSDNKNKLEGFNKDVENFFFESEAFIESTYPYYSKLIDLYISKEDELINQLGVHSVTKFNDMPQTTSVVSDNHLTTLTDNKIDDDSLSTMTRLIEIQDNLRMLYDEWARKYEEQFAITLED